MNTLVLIGIPVLIVGVFVIIVLAIAFPYISRALIKSTGDAAEVTILGKSMGKHKSYGSEHSLIAEEIILKLEVRPALGAPYQTEIRYMANIMDSMRLEPGCIVQAKVARGNPNKVVVLAETSRSGANTSFQSRAQVAIMNFAEQASHGGGTDPQKVMEVMNAEGVRVHNANPQEDPQVKLEKIKNMLNSGLITQKEFETKKTEILSRI